MENDQVYGGYVCHGVTLTFYSVIFMLSFQILLPHIFFKTIMTKPLAFFNREIYHCPYCNLCRVGKGLGVDYFHCMNCNACMARSLMIHACREKSLEENCPICHEYIFTSLSPVKALPCGHVMHSACFQVFTFTFTFFTQSCSKNKDNLVAFVVDFQEYTCFNYTCPICSKSLGDMQVSHYLSLHIVY